MLTGQQKANQLKNILKNSMKKSELNKMIASDSQHLLRLEDESKIAYTFKRFKCWASLVHHKSVDFGDITNGERLGFALVLVVGLVLLLIN